MRSRKYPRLWETPPSRTNAFELAPGACGEAAGAPRTRRRPADGRRGHVESEFVARDTPAVLSPPRPVPSWKRLNCGSTTFALTSCVPASYRHLDRRSALATTTTAAPGRPGGRPTSRGLVRLAAPLRRLVAAWCVGHTPVPHCHCRVLLPSLLCWQPASSVGPNGSTIRRGWLPACMHRPGRTASHASTYRLWLTLNHHRAPTPHPTTTNAPRQPSIRFDGACVLGLAPMHHRRAGVGLCTHCVSSQGPQSETFSPHTVWRWASQSTRPSPSASVQLISRPRAYRAAAVEPQS